MKNIEEKNQAYNHDIIKNKRMGEKGKQKVYGIIISFFQRPSVIE